MTRLYGLSFNYRGLSLCLGFEYRVVMSKCVIAHYISWCDCTLFKSKAFKINLNEAQFVCMFLKLALIVDHTVKS